MEVHGFQFTPIQDGEAYSVNLNDQVVVLSKEDGDRIAQEAQTADDVIRLVQEAKAQASSEWTAKRDEQTARSESDQNTMDTARDASSGESHQESESNPGQGREA